jgi:4-amino-4-deoxy-L-arabinose transferase-like glycosyltransferase
MPRISQGRLLLFVFYLALVPALLPVREVMPPDEPRFTHQAQEMKEDREWAVPKIGDVTSPDKPPGLFWAIDLASLTLPRVTEFTARIPSALAALIVLLLTVRLGRRLFGSEEIGLGAALVLLTGIEFFQKTQWIACDMLLTAGVFLALTCFREALFEDGHLLFFGWCAAGAAVLTKGPIGLLWALLWVGAEAVVRRRWWSVFRLLHLPGLAAFALIVGGWYYAFRAHAGGANLYNQIFTQNVTRYLSAWNSVNPWYFYFYQTPLDLLPWSLFLPGALALVLLQIRRGESACDPVALRASTIFAVVGFAFFTGSSGKRGVYLLQIFPVVSLLIAAAFLTAGRAGSIGRAWRSAGLAGMIVLGLAIGLGVPVAVQSKRIAALATGLRGWDAAAFALGGLALAAGAVMALRLARRSRPEAALRSAAAGLAVLLFVVGSVGGAAWNRNQGARAYGRQIEALVPAGARIAVERGRFEQILFYSARKGTEFETEEQAADSLRSGRCSYAILSEKRYQGLRDHDPFREMPVLLTSHLSVTRLLLLGPAARPDSSPSSPPR